MRISDWSSDVCSSDLAKVDRRVNLRIAEFHQHIIAADAQLRRAVRDKGGDIERANADQLHIRPTGRKTQRPRSFVGERRFGLDPGCRQQRECFLQRSEAHTSELQSLMRISYAVFCLTNKTINKH